jgi:hypothetical protein
MDNWSAGVFFRTDPELLGSGEFHYRSFFHPPAVAFDRGKLTIAIGSGEREHLRYEGVSTEDENNRFYVIRDLFPTGVNAFASVITEPDLTDSTLTATDQNTTDSGYYFTVSDGEKFVTDVTIFANHVIVASYNPDGGGADECTAAGGEASLYVFDLGTGQGLFADAMTPVDPEEDRRMSLGGGLPTSPKVSMSDDPGDDRVYIKTSTGQVISIDLDIRSESPSSVYWRQVY